MEETWRKHEGKWEEKGDLLISFGFGEGFWGWGVGVVGWKAKWGFKSFYLTDAAVSTSEAKGPKVQGRSSVLEI